MTINTTDIGTLSHPAWELSAEDTVGGHVARVTVYGPHKAFGGELQPARVNWSAFGSVAPFEARLYGLLLERAAAFATDLNVRFGFDA